MANFSNTIFDNGLSAVQSAANEIRICSSDPTTFVESTTATLGTKTNPTFTAPSDRTGGGREIVSTAFSDGSVTANGTATHYAVVDTTTSDLLATGALSTSQVVTSGNSFSLDSFSIFIPVA